MKTDLQINLDENYYELRLITKSAEEMQLLIDLIKILKKLNKFDLDKVNED